MIIENTTGVEKSLLLKKQITRITFFIADLEWLTTFKKGTISNLQSQQYQSEYALYRQERYDFEIKLKKIKQDYNRTADLYK